MKKALFLDRDGVINRPIIVQGKPTAPTCTEDFEILPDVAKAIKIARSCNFFLCVVTNQPDVGRGLVSQGVVESMHQHIQEELGIDDIRVCYDDGYHNNSKNRKPNPGMILSAAQEFDIDLSRSFVIGDRWRDIDAGYHAGCRTIFIDYHYDEVLNSQPDYTVNNLLEAIELLQNMNL